MTVTAQECLTKNRDASRRLAETSGKGGELQKKHYEWTVRLCEELLLLVNDEATLSDQQADSLERLVSNVGYDFMPGSAGERKYNEWHSVDNMLLLQIATYINSCNV